MTIAGKKSAPAAPGRDPGTDFRVGIILVAYNAERTINAVLDRIPEAFWSRCAGVWLSDDGSGDATYKMVCDWRLSTRNCHSLSCASR